MKVVGIVGSTGSGGNTEVLTQKALAAARNDGIETELIARAPRVK